MFDEQCFAASLDKQSSNVEWQGPKQSNIDGEHLRFALQKMFDRLATSQNIA